MANLPSIVDCVRKPLSKKSLIPKLVKAADR